MKQNWWKIAVVAVLVVVVGVVLAAKNRTPLPDKGAAPEHKLTTAGTKTCGSCESDPKTEKAAAEKTEPVAQAQLADAESDAKESKPEAKPQTAAKPVAKAEADKAVTKEPVVKPVVKAEQPKAAAAKLPKILDLGADKCIPCKLMVPVLALLEKDYKGKLDVKFIDVWKDKTAYEKYNVETIPTQILYDQNGKEIFRHQGFFPKEDILKTFEKHGIKL